MSKKKKRKRHQILYGNIKLRRIVKRRYEEDFKINIKKRYAEGGISSRHSPLLFRQTSSISSIFYQLAVHPQEKMSSVIEKKMVVLGDLNCGKSFLIWKFINHKTCEFPTMATEKYCRDIIVNEQRFRLNIMDTGYPLFEERFIEPICKTDFFLTADLILLCFNIANVDSFVSIDEWIKRIKYCTKKEYPYLLVGLKEDLRCHPSINKEYVPVTTKEGKAMAKRIKAAGYVECSATCDHGVYEVFETAGRFFLREKELKEKDPITSFFKKIFRIE